MIHLARRDRRLLFPITFPSSSPRKRSSPKRLIRNKRALRYRSPSLPRLLLPPCKLGGSSFDSAAHQFTGLLYCLSSIHRTVSTVYHRLTGLSPPFASIRRTA